MRPRIIVRGLLLALLLAASAAIASASEAIADGLSSPGNPPQLGRSRAALSFRPAASGGGYAGVGDLSGIPTAVGYWGLRCYKAAYSGNVVDVYYSGAVQATLGCSSGALVSKSGASLATIESTCTTSTACYATTLYDQSGASACSGACNMTGTAGANAPMIIYSNGASNCGSGSSFIKSGLFCLETNEPYTQMVTPALGSAISQPIDYVITYATLGVGNQGEVMYNSSSTVRLLSDASATTFASYAGTAVETVTAAESAWHTGQAVFDGSTASYLQIDNVTANTGNPGTATIASGNTLGFGDGAGGIFYGFVGDFAVFDTTAIGSTLAASILANEASYWGGGMP
jgi:hypothetical protein